MTNAKKYLKDGVDEVAFAGELADLFLSKMEEKYPYAVGTFIDYFHDLAEPQLTEDERVILKNIDKKYKYIGRMEGKTIGQFYIKNEEEDFKHCFCMYNHLFQFIKFGEEYKIEELIEE